MSESGTVDAELAARARAVGVDTTYVDVHDRRHAADPAAVRTVVEMLEADAASGAGAVVEPVVVLPARPPADAGPEELVRVTTRITDAELELSDGTRTTPTVAGAGRAVHLSDRLPVGCHTLRVRTDAGEGVTTVVRPPQSMTAHAWWHGGSGLFVPTYALWDTDQPLPSFGLLTRLAEGLGALGTEVVTTLPLYATFLDEPFDPSPYAPASRLHWNEVFLDDDTLPPAAPVDTGRYLDWAAVGRRRRGQMLAAAASLDPTTSEALGRFVDARPDVAAFARFLTERTDRGVAPGGIGTDDDATTVRRSHELAQFLADRQLAALAARAREVGDGGRRAAGLAIDLPIGCHAAGYEPWAHPDRFADGVTIGAPPDLFFTGGQDWGLPPQLPGAGRRSGHRLWRDLLTRAGQHAALLRVDHVMAVHRLWWIPAGFGADQGVYVRYPREELLAVIAATAAETDTVVVGEDLGTVPPEVAEALARWEMLGMHEEQFHMTPSMLPDSGVADISARTVAGIRTHDMQPFAAFVADHGHELGEYRRRVGRVLGREVGESYGELLDAVLERLAGCDAALVTTDLDDLVGETEHHNVPGQVLDSSWCRRLDRPLSAVLADGDVRRRLTILGSRPRG